jgi:hypothetical protein
MRKNKATLSREMLGFYRGEWCSTTGRATRPALIRQSRFSHRSHRENRAWHLLPQKRAGEGMDRECRNKPTSRQRREVVPRPCQGPQGARSDEWKVQEQTHSAHSRKIAKSDETKPKRSGECWGSGTSMVLHHRSRRATGSHLPVTVLASQPSREPRLAPSPAEKSGRRDGSRMQKQTHFSATPRSGAQGRRGTSSRPARR